MRNRISDVRNHLIATMEALLDEEKPLDVERAKAVAAVGQVLIESAKAEVQFLRVVGTESSTGFIDVTPAAPALPGRVS